MGSLIKDYISLYYKREMYMERQQIIYLCSAVVVGIILGLIIGWALWHGSDAGTCPVPAIQT